MIPGKDESVALAYVRRGNTESGSSLEVEVNGAHRIARISET
jgi:hypothetical protein